MEISPPKESKLFDGDETNGGSGGSWSSSSSSLAGSPPSVGTHMSALASDWASKILNYNQGTKGDFGRFLQIVDEENTDRMSR